MALNLLNTSQRTSRSIKTIFFKVLDGLQIFLSILAASDSLPQKKNEEVESGLKW